jgi:putative acetyltransferase
LQATTNIPEVHPLRAASRQIVRELGFLENDLACFGVSHSECHALIELEHHGVLTSGELSGLLNLDKSTMSRTLGALLDKGWVAARDDSDKRRKPLTLTAKGKKRLEQIHRFADTQVGGALTLLRPEERRAVLEGMSLYAKALRRLRAQEELVIRPIERTDNPDVARIIRTVMPEFGAVGPGFAINDPEVNDMHAAYRGERARYYVVERKGERIVGGAGFAPLAGSKGDTCELRKMYFLSEARGTGMGHRLLDRVLTEAREAGYSRCYLETLESMADARRLYTAAGFKPLKKPLGATGHFGCDAWYALKFRSPTR